MQMLMLMFKYIAVVLVQRMLFVCVSCRQLKVSLARLVLGPTMAVTLLGVMTGARLPSLDRTALSKYSLPDLSSARPGSCSEPFSVFM